MEGPKLYKTATQLLGTASQHDAHHGCSSWLLGATACAHSCCSARLTLRTCGLAREARLASQLCSGSAAGAAGEWSQMLTCRSMMSYNLSLARYLPTRAQRHVSSRYTAQRVRHAGRVAACALRRFTWSRHFRTPSCEWRLLQAGPRRRASGLAGVWHVRRCWCAGSVHLRKRQLLIDLVDD